MPRIGHPGPRPGLALGDVSRETSGVRRPAPARHHNGRRPGTPTRRGHRSPAGSAAVEESDPGSFSPPQLRPEQAQFGQPGRGQRSGSGSPGGSLTTRRPPAARNPTAHSAVVAGDPKPRATTRSNTPRSSGCRASSSARPQATDARSLSPSPLTAASRNEHRRRRASSRIPVAAGHRASRIRPGTPRRSRDRGIGLGRRRPRPPPSPRRDRDALRPVPARASPACGRPRAGPSGDGANLGRAPLAGDHAGRITTRRRGSSPSEVVATPSISATTSCTTFRSDADMGSSACSASSSRTRSAS